MRSQPGPRRSEASRPTAGAKPAAAFPCRIRFRCGGLTPESWSRLELLFEQALTRPDHARPAFLDGACGGDAALRREVEALLDAHARTDGPLEHLVVEFGAQALDVRGASDWTGRNVGPYTVVREIGRGGMGTVYLARRSDGQYDRDVALKVIQSPLDSLQRARFVAERQILARLSHPGIAQLFDGGLTDEGFPYFTMEYVEGMRIDRYCDDHELDVASRLRIFGQVCEAVAAAHRSLVVHRDLKPSNILTRPDGTIKLVDFGIAKPLDPAVAMDLTRTGTELFTPDYASPEQVSGAAITTASDVYSLGAVLYQLLTGLKAHRFTSKTPAAVERTICEGETPPPSRAVGALGSAHGPAPDSMAHDAERIARVRRTRPDRLTASPRGRPGYDRDEGAAQGSRAPLRVGGPPAAGHQQPSRRAAGRRPAGPLDVSRPEVRRAASCVGARRWVDRRIARRWPRRDDDRGAARPRTAGDRSRRARSRPRRSRACQTRIRAHHGALQAGGSVALAGRVDHRSRNPRSRRAAGRSGAWRRSRDAGGPVRHDRPGLSQSRAVRSLRSSAAAGAGAAHQDVRP